MYSRLNWALESNCFISKVRLNRKNVDISKFLFKNGFLYSYILEKKENAIILFVNFNYFKKPIISIKKISSAGRKIYISWRSLKNVSIYKNHFLILSTNKGIKSNKEAVSERIGGELLYIIKC